MDKCKLKKRAAKKRKRIEDSLLGQEIADRGENRLSGERKLERRGEGRMMNEFRAGHVS